MAKFKPGQTGNPNGRPRGAKTTAKLLVSDFITDEDVRAVVNTVVAAAKDGDITAATLVLDRVLPRLKPTVADPAAEAELAAAITQAKMRGLSGSGLLETIVSGGPMFVVTGVPEPEPAVLHPPAPTERPPAVEAVQAPPPAEPPRPRAVSIPIPPLPLDLGAVSTDYDPLGDNA